MSQRLAAIEWMRSAAVGHWRLASIVAAGAAVASGGQAPRPDRRRAELSGLTRNVLTVFWMRLRASVSILSIPADLSLARIEQARDVENESHGSH